jgi:hypothetical protein
MSLSHHMCLLYLLTLCTHLFQITLISLGKKRLSFLAIIRQKLFDHYFKTYKVLLCLLKLKVKLSL